MDKHLALEVKSKGTDKRQRIILLLTIGSALWLAFSCRQPASGGPGTDGNALLNIYFFHLTARCDACTAIEENTNLILGKFFGSQLENGTIRFRSLNIESRENRAIAEKFQVSYTSLLLVSRDGKVTDFTQTSMNYAFMNPSEFGELLKAEINKNLE